MKNNYTLPRVLWALVTLMFLLGNASAATRYVASSGSDSGNNCLDFGTPCATITHAAGQADAGDTILMATGHYNQSALINQSITLNGGGGTLAGAIRLAGNDITISNLTVLGGDTVLGETAGIYIDANTSGQVIANNTLQGAGLPAARGIIFGANVSNISISNNVIDGWVTGMYINPSADASITISGNTISNNVAGVGGDNYSDVTLSDNDFIDNDEGIGYSGTAAGPTVIDNTFSGNTVIVQSYGDAQLDVEAIAAGNTLGSNVLNLTQASVYNSIQAGIDAANDGDVLQASAGVFAESLVIAGVAELTLLGAQAGTRPFEGRVAGDAAESVIDGQGGVQTIRIGAGAPGLTIDGFSITSTTGTTRGVVEITPLVGTTVRNNFIYGYPASLGVSVSAGSTGSLVGSSRFCVG